jgi:hypothetical protein
LGFGVWGCGFLRLLLLLTRSTLATITVPLPPFCPATILGYGLWLVVYGLWFMVYGLWFMVHFQTANLVGHGFGQQLHRELP